MGLEMIGVQFDQAGHDQIAARILAAGGRIAFAKFGDQVVIHAHGEGFTWETQDRARDIANAEAGWALAVGMIEAARESSAYDLLVFDELNIALRYDYLPKEEVLADLRRRRANQHVVITGRNVLPELIEYADLVTEMREIKHPFKTGVKAQAGVEF